LQILLRGPEYRVVEIVPALPRTELAAELEVEPAEPLGGSINAADIITLGAFFHKVSDGRRVGISVINDIDKKMGSTQQRKPVVPMRRRIGPKSEFLPRLHGRVSAQSAHQRYDYC
jgi:hypothetical protein